MAMLEGEVWLVRGTAQLVSHRPSGLSGLGSRPVGGRYHWPPQGGDTTGRFVGEDYTSNPRVTSHGQPDRQAGRHGCDSPAVATAVRTQAGGRGSPTRSSQRGSGDPRPRPWWRRRSRRRLVAQHMSIPPATTSPLGCLRILRSPWSLTTSSHRRFVPQAWPRIGRQSTTVTTGDHRVAM